MPIKCRKCNGDHFTSKCGANDTKNNVFDKKTNESENIVKEFIKEINPDDIEKEYLQESIKHDKRRNKIRKPRMGGYEKVFKVKIDNIPSDLSLKNLNKMMLGWGKIGNVKLANDRRDNIKYAVIDFYEKDAMNYFIEAIDNTPIGHNMIRVMKY